MRNVLIDMCYVEKCVRILSPLPMDKSYISQSSATYSVLSGQEWCVHILVGGLASLLSCLIGVKNLHLWDPSTFWYKSNQWWNKWSVLSMTYQTSKKHLNRDHWNNCPRFHPGLNLWQLHFHYIYVSKFLSSLPKPRAGLHSSWGLTSFYP